jgi:hypothetical protein
VKTKLKIQKDSLFALRNISLNTAAHKEIVKGDNIKLLTKVYLSRIERILEELSNSNEDSNLEDICP